MNASARPLNTPPELLERIAREFPADFLTRDPDELAEYGRDWTKVHAPAPTAVAFPRMRRMDPIDLLGATVRVQAGAVTEAVHQHCEAAGLTWPVDFASKGSS